METSEIEETRPLVPRPGIPTAVQDNRKAYQKKLAVYFILTSVLFERMAFYALGNNLVVYLESDKFNWNPKKSATAVYIFYGTTYISTLLFAVVSDAKLGRAITIIIGFIVYLTGYILFTINAERSPGLCSSGKNNYLNSLLIADQYCASGILGTLICTAIGAGAVQSNMAVFGAEQIQESQITSRYFDKYMVAINIGGIIATLGIPYIQNKAESHYLTAFIVAASMLLVGALVFLIGWRYYIHVKSDETVVTKCIPVIISAFQSWCKYKKTKRSVGKKHLNSSNLTNASDSLMENEESIRIIERPRTFIDFAKAPNGGKFHDRIVDDVKSLQGALVLFTLVIPYWLAYNQLFATFPLQGQQMYTPPGEEHTITWMNLGDPVTILIGIFILNMFIYKYFKTQNPIMTMTTKFVVGMFFAFTVMCIAGIVEKIRQYNCDINAVPLSNSSTLSIYYQLPQNIGMGLSELFAMIASYEFAYFAAPRSAQSLFMSLRFCSLGISSFINTAYMYVFPKPGFELDFRCLSDKDFQWSFYTYFFILAALQLLFIIILILYQKKYRIIKVHPDKLEQNPFL